MNRKLETYSIESLIRTRRLHLYFVDLYNREIIGYSAGPEKSAALVQRTFASVPHSLNRSNCSIAIGTVSLKISLSIKLLRSLTSSVPER